MMNKKKEDTLEPVQQNIYIPLAALFPHARNYKNHPPSQIKKLKASLERWGQVRSLVCQDLGNGSYTIIAGHGLVQAAQELVDSNTSYYERFGKLRSDVIPQSWTPEQASGYLVADNLLSQDATDDEELLAQLLQEQSDAGFDLESLGTDDETLRQMLEALGDEYAGGGQEEGDGGDEFDTTPQEGPTRTHVGEIWQLGKHRLMVGDCTKAENIQKLMQGKHANMAWFDPPFGIDLVPQRGLNEAITNDEQVDAQCVWKNFLPLLYECLLDDTVAFLCQRWDVFDWTLPLVRKYFKVKSKIVWYKTQWGIGYYLRPQHEDVLYCWKGTPPKPLEAISDVWEIARLNAPVHAAEKPVTLVQTAIEFACNNGDIVIDWFSGVGATVIACERTNRVAYLAELEPRHADITIKRWEAETGEQATLLERIEETTNAH